MSCGVSDLTSTLCGENLASSPFALVVGRRASGLATSCGGRTRGVGIRWSSRSLCARPRPARAVATMMLVGLAFEIASGIGAAQSGWRSVWWWSTQPGAVDHLPACYMSVVACVTSYVPGQEIRSTQPTWCSSRGSPSLAETTRGSMHVRLTRSGPGSGVGIDGRKKLKNMRMKMCRAKGPGEMGRVMGPQWAEVCLRWCLNSDSS